MRVVTMLLIGIVSLNQIHSDEREDRNESSATVLKFNTPDTYGWSGSLLTSIVAEREIRVEGASEREGATAITLRFGDRTIQGYSFGNKIFVTSPDIKWKDVPEMRKGESPGEFMERMIREVTPPARQIQELTRRAGELRKEGEMYSAALPEASARGLMESQKIRRSEIPELKNASGAVKFWTKDGTVTRYEFQVRGKRTVEGRETNYDRTTTVELKDVGTARVEVPDRVKEKLGIK